MVAEVGVEVVEEGDAVRVRGTLLRLLCVERSVYWKPYRDRYLVSCKVSSACIQSQFTPRLDTQRFTLDAWLKKGRGEEDEVVEEGDVVCVRGALRFLRSIHSHLTRRLKSHFARRL